MFPHIGLPLPPRAALSELWGLFPSSLCLQASRPWSQCPPPSVPGAAHGSLGAVPSLGLLAERNKEGLEGKVADKGRAGEW